MKVKKTYYAIDILFMGMAICLSGCNLAVPNPVENGESTIQEEKSELDEPNTAVETESLSEENETEPQMEEIIIPKRSSFLDMRSRVAQQGTVSCYISGEGKIAAVDEKLQWLIPKIDYEAVDLETYGDYLIVTAETGKVHLYKITLDQPGVEVTKEDVESILARIGEDASFSVVDLYEGLLGLLQAYDVKDVSVNQGYCNELFALVGEGDSAKVVLYCGNEPYIATLDDSHGEPVGISGHIVLFSDGTVEKISGPIHQDDYDYSSWHDVIGVFAGGEFGIREDGNVYVRDHKYATVRKWENISYISVGFNSNSPYGVYALTNDGTILNAYTERYEPDYFRREDKNISEMLVCDQKLICLDENSEPIVYDLPN